MWCCIDSGEEKIVNTTLDGPNLGARSSEGPTFSYLSENDQLSLESLSTTVPPDQIRMIQSINTLISEVASCIKSLRLIIFAPSTTCLLSCLYISRHFYHLKELNNFLPTWMLIVNLGERRVDESLVTGIISVLWIAGNLREAVLVTC